MTNELTEKGPIRGPVWPFSPILSAPMCPHCVHFDFAYTP